LTFSQAFFNLCAAWFLETARPPAGGARVRNTTEDTMRTGSASRRERIGARDAGVRRIAWWTAALALGSVGGTAAVATAAQVATRTATASPDVPSTDQGGAQDPAGGQDQGSAHDPGAANPGGAGSPYQAPVAQPNYQVPRVVTSGS
jgi:hypothetical protein